MKCRSVACLWSGTPPPHRVTAVASFSQPPSFYTGASDGSIIWWALSDSYSSPEVKAVGILCGHAAPITDLGTCSPIMAEKDTDSSSNLVVESTSSSSSALISACTDGFLCVWSRSSGHCRCRRKLPPWVGSPCMIRTLPSRARYVCIGCSFMDSVHLSDHYSVNSMEGNDGIIDRETQPRKPPKCTIVIVDTYSLTITQTVFHGNLSIGPMNFMTVVPMDNDKESHSIFVADSVGKQQMVSVSKDPHDQGENFYSMNKDLSQLESSVWAEGSSGVQQIISIATHGNVAAFLFKDRCIFKLLSSDTKLGEISFLDNLLCSDEHSTQTHAMGAMFLETVGARTVPNFHEKSCLIPENFVVWNNIGYAVVYKLSDLNDIFQCEPHSEIPSYYKPDMRVSVFFLQVYHWLLRVESVCFHFEDPSLWRPHVTIWSPHHFDNKHGKFYQQCRMLSEGVSFTDLFENSAQLRGLNSVGTESTSSLECLSNCNSNEGKIVTSSMIISESLVAPYAVVYGFLSGLIEVVRFDLFQRMGLDSASSKTEEKPILCKQYFSGHTGAILCLAAHQVMGSSKGQSFNQVLVSGSVDCTVRIWDLDTGCLIMVMHHHVAPVRQIILPPSSTDRPWSNCFLSIGDDSCVALVSLETLQVERMFPGHMNYPSKVVWDGVRGYIACLCQTHTGTSDTSVLLYIWDVKTGCRERILRGTAAHSMFDHFCDSISMNSTSGTLLNENTSVSSLHLPAVEDGRLFKSSSSTSGSLVTSSRSSPSILKVAELNASQTHVDKPNKDKSYSSSLSTFWSKKHPIKCSSPFPGIVALSFDLASLMFSYQKHMSIVGGGSEPVNMNSNQQEIQKGNSNHESQETREVLTDTVEGHDKLFEEYLLRFSLSFLHLWDVDTELDDLLMRDMKLRRPENFKIAAGLQGDRGSLTLTFPGLSAVLELWKSSAEFCAMRSLMMVSLAQRLISMSHFDSAASSSLAAFYTRNFTEKIPDVKPPSLQLLVAFWQAESEHVRMAARSLFHCAASHAIPPPLCNLNATGQTNINSVAGSRGEEQGNTGLKCNDKVIIQTEESIILAWLESFEVQDWISCVGGTSQDAMTSRIIVAAALAIWYPSLVKPSVATLVVHPLMKLAMAMNEKYSSTAAELLAEGMENTWKDCIGYEIPRLIGDIFFQIELNGSSTNLVAEIPAVSVSIRQSLIEILLPSLAMADISGFLTLVESQIWSTASDSPVHLVSLMTLIRVMRGSPRNLAQYLDKVVNFILHTIDPSNSVMRKTCFQSSMTTLKEVIRVYPMVAVNDTWTRLAVGDVIREVNNPSIKVYDMQSVTMIKVLDASGPPGLPSLLAAGSETMFTAISALSFSPDGEGLVAFSEHGLMIRWWSLGSVWWEKLSRNLVPVQCTKVIFVPPWEGFSPNSSRSSIMANILGADGQSKSRENARDPGHEDSLKQLLHNLDLSYRLEWVGDRKILLSRHGHELGTFQL